MSVCSNTFKPRGHASQAQSQAQSSQDGRCDIYNPSTTSPRLGWDSRSASPQSPNELNLSCMPKMQDFRAEVSFSTLSNTPHYTTTSTSLDLDFSNDEVHRATESSGMDEGAGPYPVSRIRDATKKIQRYYCRFEDCRHTKGFARINDLKRHQKKHDGETPLWYCGCCKNMGDEGYKGTPRKDHLKQHLMNKHQMEAPLDCPEKPCSGNGRVLFSSGACVEEHLRQEHGYTNTYEATSSGYVPLFLKNYGDNSPWHPATDRYAPSSPARSMTIKRLIQTESEQLPKRRRQDSTYGSCNTSEVASTETTSTEPTLAVEEIPRGPGSSSTIEMPVDILGLSRATNFGYSHGLNGPPRFLPDFMRDGCEAWERMGIAANFDPFADSVLGLFESDTLMPLGLEKVPNVHPTDFLALYRTKSWSLSILLIPSLTGFKGSNRIQKLPTAAVKFLQIAEATSVSYNPRTKTMNLRGDITLLESAKDQLQAVMLEVSRECGLQYLQRKHKELQRKTNVDTLHDTSANQPYDGDRSANIFALRVKQDSMFITTWIDFLLPRLPTILDPAIGHDYGVSLVRQGASEAEARPHIRIQSPRKLRSATRKNIKQAIDEICESNMRDCILVFFCKGYLRLLANATSLQSVENCSLVSDEEEDDDPGFQTKRYWQTPGMGASIGMRCTNVVSATSGGYVLVDGRKFLLTVEHFIGKSYKENIAILPENWNLFTLTSPALCDVEEMRMRLDATFRDLNAKSELLSKEPGDGEISLNDLHLSGIEEILHDMDVIENYQSELSRPEQDFILGELAGRCRPTATLSIDAESSSSPPESAMSCRMDWAMFNVENRRIGENRHRFQAGSDSELAETTGDNSPNWAGDGDFCSDTCELEPNAKVHYVGSTSGRREGQINAVPMLLSIRGLRTTEWALISPEQISRSEGCEGDSGAWVLRDVDNKLVGLLWGWFDGQLLFSPIDKVFADIQNTFPARDVRLPREPIRREPSEMAISGNAVREPVLICAVKKRKRAKPYKLTTLIRSRPNTVQSILPAKGSIGNEATPSHDQLSSYSSVELNISSPVEYSSASRIADASSREQLSANKQPESKCKQVIHVFHNQHRKVSKTDPGLGSIMHERRRRVRAASARSECVSHMKCQSPLRDILMPRSTSLLAVHPFPSKSHPMKPMCRSNTFPYSKKDPTPQSRPHGFKSSNSYLRIGKSKDLSQSNFYSE
ncbi:hypothetical protein MMC29_002588 [Sticta canariensis]|nr:hypothetical protein [Sticta canariensis]